MQSVQPSVFKNESEIPTGLLTPPSPPPSVRPQEANDEPPDSNQTNPNSASRALEIIAEELGVDARMLNDDAQIADFGLDSLISLVLSQRLRQELKLEIRDAFFLEISTFGDLKALLG
jgi:monodictyphenone polyketide synthase